MAHGTTLPAPVREVLPRSPRALVDPGQEPGGLRVEVDGQRFRGQSARFSTQWLPETPSHRHLTLGWLRVCVDAQGKPLCTLPELAVLVGRTNRQAASQHLEDLRPCGEDVRAFVLRKRKVDARVVEGGLHEILKTPLAGPTALVSRVQRRLGRMELTAAHIECAWEQLSWVPVLRVLRQQVETGQGHEQEAALWTERLESLSLPALPPAGGSGPSAERGMRLADPTALAALVPPEVPLAPIPGSLWWLTFLMTLCYWHVPLSVLGRGCGVHKTTSVRWVVGFAVALWPLVYQGIAERVKAHMVYVDAKWLKIRGRWHDWFGVLEVTTELPVLAALLPSRSPWTWRWLSAQLRRLNKVPQVISTDGLQAYAYLAQGAKHVLCRLHHQQRVTQWLQQPFTTEEEINTRKKGMKKVLQTHDTRTVRRRLARLKGQAPPLGILPWGSGVEEKLPQLLCSVGRRRLPATTNAMERFFRAFQHFYCTRGGFHSVLSAKRELLLFLVVSVFTQHATTGQAPIEVIMPAARSMPLYRLINDPFRALQERGDVKREVEMADWLRPQEAAA
jgi:transposase-like protein